MNITSWKVRFVFCKPVSRSAAKNQIGVRVTTLTPVIEKNLRHAWGSSLPDRAHSLKASRLITSWSGKDAAMSLLGTQAANSSNRYERHRPQTTLLYQLVSQYYPQFQELMAQQETLLPGYIQQEFEAYLKCGRLEHGFLRVRCECCHHEKLVAFSCKRRGFCPSSGARRMVDSAALLTDEVLPKVPLRQWVLSVPFQLRFLFASNLPPTLPSSILVQSTWLLSCQAISAGVLYPSMECGRHSL